MIKRITQIPSYLDNMLEVNYDTNKPVFKEKLISAQAIVHDHTNRLVKYKLIQCGHIIELYDYSTTPILKGKKNIGSAKAKIETEETEITVSAELGKRQDNLRNTENRLRRIINANVTGNDRFITFTFKEEIEDINEANRLWKLFIERWNDRRKTLGLAKLAYVSVLEIQQERAKKYGVEVWHYHVIFFNLDFVDFKELYSTWKYGGINIKKIDINTVDNIGSYIIKYMQKDMSNPRLKGKKVYNSSLGLNKPIEMEITSVTADMVQAIYQDALIFESQYTHKITEETIFYKQYNLKQNEEYRRIRQHTKDK